MEKKCNEPETGCDLNCMDCEVPQIEPEYCQDCYNQSKIDGIEYEFLVTHKNGFWECEHCGQCV